MKTTISTLIVAAMIALLAGCSSKGTTTGEAAAVEDRSLGVGLIVLLTSIQTRPYQAALRQTLKEAVGGSGSRARQSDQLSTLQIE